MRRPTIARSAAGLLLRGRATVLAAALLGSGLGVARAEDPPEVPREVEAAIAGMASEDRPTRQAAAEGARALQHEALLAPLLKLLKDEYRVVRQAAMQALAAREAKAERAKAARAVETRLKELDRAAEGREELDVAVQALHDLAQPTSIEPLLDGIQATTESGVALARLKAVGNVPTKEAVEALIDHASRGRRGGENHRAAALKALEYATGVKLGSLDAWHRWWADNKRTYDPEAAAAARQAAREAEAAKQREREERRAKRAEARKPGEPPSGDEAPAR